MTTSNTSEIEETQGPRWYIVHTYSGQEDLVEKNLRLRIQSLDMQDRINEVLVPTEEEVIFKDGQRRSERKKLFPGYILVQMNMDDESWYLVRNTPGVTGFGVPRFFVNNYVWKMPVFFFFLQKPLKSLNISQTR